MPDTSTSVSRRGSSRRRPLSLCILCVAGTLTAQTTVPVRVPFADEASQQADFKTFRDRLVASAERGDYGSIRPILDRMIQVEPGVYGTKELEKQWNIRTSPRPFLRSLAEVLRLGGRFRENGQVFVAPYVWTDFPDVEDEFLYAVVVQPATKLFSRPARSASVVATLSNEVMQKQLSTTPGWYEVTLIDGRVGFIEAARVRQPNDYHATFRKIGGQWRLAEFSGGPH